MIRLMYLVVNVNFITVEAIDFKEKQRKLNFENFLREYFINKSLYNSFNIVI